jgi:hypothetical protein
MIKKAVAVLLVSVLALALAGCSPCGFIWDDWRSSKSCRGEPAPQK